jgi:hypothetical protein
MEKNKEKINLNKNFKPVDFLKEFTFKPILNKNKNDN